MNAGACFVPPATARAETAPAHHPYQLRRCYPDTFPDLNGWFGLSEHGSRQSLMNSRRLKILTVQFKLLGDTVVSIPALMAIRQHFPDCELHALVPEASVPLLQHHPA